MVSYKEKSLNTLDIPHWCWGTELRLDKRKARKRYNEAKRHVRCESEIEGKKGGERREAGWTEGVEGDRDQAGCRQWGNNDMKELNWRSHTTLAHLRRHKISWPLHAHTYRHTQTYMNDSKATYTSRCTFAHWHKESLSHTHTHSQRL